MAAKVKALLQWCKVRSDGYRDVQVTNFTSSFKSGLVFCAIIHRYRPDLIDYDSLRKEDVYENNKLAFRVAQEELGIAALLDAEDMVKMRVPDKLCIVTYVSQYYNYFRDKEPATGGAAKRIAAKRPPQPETNRTAEAQNNKKPTPTKVLEEVDVKTKPGSKLEYGETCSMCKDRVFLMERHIEGKKLYHRRCFRELERSQLSASLKRGLQSSAAFANQGKITEENKENIKKPRTTEFENHWALKSIDVQRQQPKEDVPNPFKEELEAKGLMQATTASPQTHRHQNGASARTYIANPADKSSSQALPKSAVHSTTSEKSQPSFGLTFSSKLSNISDNQVKQSLLQNLTKIRQTHDNEKPEPKTEKDSFNRKSALNISLDNFPKKDTSKPSTASHKVGLTSPQGYKSLFGNSNSSLAFTSSPSADAKSVTKNPGDAEVQNAGLHSRSNLKSDPPGLHQKSILKQDASSIDLLNRNRTTSPEEPRSILKHNNNSISQERKGWSNLSTAPSHSILKSKSPVNSLDTSKSRELAMSPPRSILKFPEEARNYSPQDIRQPILKKGGKDDSGNEHLQPTLRKKPDDIDLDSLVEANLPSRPILKKPLVEKSDDEFPKPILKNITDTDKNESSGSDTSYRPSQSAGVFVHQHPMGKTNERVGPTFGTKPTQPSKAYDEPLKPLLNGKTVLKSGDNLTGLSRPAQEGRERPGPVSSGSETLPDWKLEAQKRQAARGNQYDDPEKKKVGQQNDQSKNGQSGDRSSTSSTDRFLRNHGVFFGESAKSNQKSGSGIKSEGPKIDTTATKADYNAPKLGATDLTILPKSNGNVDNPIWKKPDDNKGKLPSTLTHDSNDRPAWQIEAERRTALRNGQYPDPEKDPGSVRPLLKSATEPKTGPSNKWSTTNSNSGGTKAVLNGQSDKNKTPNGKTGLNSNTEKPSSVATRPNVLQTKVNTAIGGGTTQTPSGMSQSPVKTSTNKNTVYHSLALAFDTADKAPRTETWTPVPVSSTSASSSSMPSKLSPVRTHSPFSVGSPTYKKQIGMQDRADSPLSPLSPLYKTGINSPLTQHRQAWTPSSNVSPLQIQTTSPLASSNKTTAPINAWSHKTQLHSPAASPAPLPHRTDSPFSDRSNRSSPLSSPRSGTPTSPSHKTYPGSPTNVSYPTSYGASKLLTDSNTSPSQKPSNQFNYSNRDLVDKYRTATKRTMTNQEQPSGDEYKIYDNAANKTGHVYQSMSKTNLKSGTGESGTHFGSDHRNSTHIPLDTYTVSSQRMTPALRPAPGTSISAYPAREPQRRKIGADKKFFFAKNEFEIPDPTYSELEKDRFRTQERSSPALPPRSYQMTGRPLPPVPYYGRENRRRTISAEERIPPEIILRRLENLDGQLRQLEEEGRQLEIKLRECDDDALENELLTAWFDLVNKKNGLVRDEVDLVYKQRQQELEDIHEELEFELRLLLEKPGHMKTASDKVREESLLQELLHTVSERNSIIDSMEEDRLRYREEDEVISKVMMAKSVEGYGGNSDEEQDEGSSKKKSKKKNKKLKNKKNKMKEKKSKKKIKEKITEE